MGFLETLFKSASRTIGREVGKKAVNAVVDIFDDDDKKKKSKSKADTTAQKKTVKKAAEVEEIKAENPNIAASSPMAMAAAKGDSPYDTTPDMPCPFVEFNGWLCIKGGTPQEIIKTLGLKNSYEANWESGLKAASENFMKKVFVSPVINGCVLVIGYIPFGVKNSVKEELAVLDKIADKFDEMTCFATQSTVDIHVWAKYVNGKLKRGYGWLGESGVVYLNQGNPTPEEVRLGYDKLITDTDCDWETAQFADTEHVFTMSKEWGISPDLSDVDGKEGTGFVCDL
ncbi:MAG: hypothetical protein J6A41_00945 [Ruminiclostridium sp.]|nr:hypothetical protein [Ruminiclostridium sp.]